MKQMFDISEKLITEQSNEIYGVNTINWKILHGSIYLWLVMKKSSVSRAQRLTYFQILCYALERWARTHNQIMHGNKDWSGSKVHRNTELWHNWWHPMEFEWNIFPGFTTLQLCHKVQELLSRWNETPEDFTGRIIFMSMFNDISWGSKENMQECELSAQLRFYLCKKISTKEMVIPWTWIRKEVVFY